MKCIYLWIENYKNIKNQGFNFGSPYHFDFDMNTNTLTCTENKEYTENFFGENIDVTAIVGKNGAGKTNIIQHLFNQLIRNYMSFGDDIYITIFLNKEGELCLFSNIEPEINQSYTIINYFGDYTNPSKEILHRNFIFYSDNFQPSKYINTDFITSDIYVNLYNLSRESLLLRNLKSNSLTKNSIFSYYLEDYNQQVLFLAQKELINTLRTNIKDFHFPKSLIITQNKDIKIELEKKLKNKASSIDVVEKINQIKSSELDGHFLEIAKTFLFNLFVEEFDANDIVNGKYNTNEPFIDVMIDILNSSVSLEKFFKEVIKQEKEKKAQLNHRFQNLILAFNNFMMKLKNESRNKDLSKSLYTPRLFLSFKNSSIAPEILNNYKLTFTHVSYLNFTWSTLLSSGEETLLNFMGRISSIFNENFTDKRHHNSGQDEYETLMYTYEDNPKSIKKVNKYRDITLIIDEGEISLHPDWQKRYLNIIIKFMKILMKEYGMENKHLQIILTTHSPFILSDIPKANVIFLNKDEHGHCKVENDVLGNTFGANIHTLLANSFFLENGTMGEFAKEKINDVITFLNLNKEKKNREVKLIDPNYIRND